MVGVNFRNLNVRGFWCPLPVKWLRFLLVWSLMVFMAVEASATKYPPPLLLSFDVEDRHDIAALNKLNVREPATYFVTGQFARQFPQFVRKLAENGTIGSHSDAHPHYTRMEPKAVRADLAASQRAIKAATGQTPLLFRAPYLQYDDDTLKIARDLGFRYDSSELERWLHQKVLVEFPISMNTTQKVLFSDYDLFKTYRMDADIVLDLLKENYRTRISTGRPFVFLLHPRIIGEQAETLRAFIRFVKAQGGKCLTFDQYLRKIDAHRPDRKGVRIDLRPGALIPESYVQALIDAGITDAFLMATDSKGKKYYQPPEPGARSDEMLFTRLKRRLQAAGVRVHAWISVNRNERRARQFPSQAMASQDGIISKQWISTSHPQTHRNLRETIRELLTGDNLDGIHLDHIEFPGLDYDFSAVAVQAFQNETGIFVRGENQAYQLRGEHYDEWAAWRTRQITRLVKTAAESVKRHGRKNIVLSAALHARAASDYKIMETTGQDYRLLAADLDMIIPTGINFAGSREHPRIEAFLSTARFLIGEKALLIGIPISDRLLIDSAQQKEAVNALRSSGRGIQGVVFSLEPKFKSAGQPAGNFPDAFINIVKRTEAIWQEESQRSAYSSIAQSERGSGDWRWISLGALLIVAVILVALLTFISRRYRKTKKIATTDINLSNSPKAATLPDWRKLDRDIANGSITCQLIKDVAVLLRQYDPTNVSQYRIAIILDIIGSHSDPMNVSALMELDVQVPGWQVLSMSYFEEALLLGYIGLQDGCAVLSAKGQDEIRRIKSNGFNREYWMFVERRLHESLVASCPNCSAENVTHWFWPTFNCYKCNREVQLASCADFACRSAKIALNHYRIA